MKKGFTLVETIAAIVVLGVIAIIAIPKIQNALFHSQDEAYEMKIGRIEQTAYDYFISNGLDKIVTANKSVDVYLFEMLEEGYIDEDDLEDPRSKKNVMDENSSYIRFSILEGSLVSTPYIVIRTR